MENYNGPQLAEIKDISCRILSDFDSYCKKYDLKYYLAYGTLLGAVRHKGFIPWDDDIDVIMPRKDYELFIDNMAAEGIPNSCLMCSRTNASFPYPFAKLCDTKTIVVENKIRSDIKSNYSHGVWIDLFPLDGLPENGLLRKWMLFKLKLLNKFRIFLVTDIRNIKMNSILKGFIFSLGWIKRIVDYKKMIQYYDRITMRYGYDSSSYVREEERCIDKQWLGEGIDLTFESKKYPCPIDWNSYLQVNYGDYMRLPTEEKRISNHDYTFSYK